MERRRLRLPFLWGLRVGKNLDRYCHAIREIERFARLRQLHAESPEDFDQAKKLVRLVVGSRRILDQWSARTSTEQQPAKSRRKASPRYRSTVASLANAVS